MDQDIPISLTIVQSRKKWTTRCIVENSLHCEDFLSLIPFRNFPGCAWNIENACSWYQYIVQEYLYWRLKFFSSSAMVNFLWGHRHGLQKRKQWNRCKWWCLRYLYNFRICSRMMAYKPFSLDGGIAAVHIQCVGLVDPKMTVLREWAQTAESPRSHS